MDPAEDEPNFDGKLWRAPVTQLEIAIEKAQVAVGEIVGGLMLPAEKSAIDAMLVEAEKEGVIAAQAEFEKDGNAAVKAAAIERAKAVAKQAVAEVAGSVRGKNGRAEADLSSSELYAAKRALISCLQGLPDDERLAKVDQHGVRGCEFEASMDWLSREEGAPILSGFRDRHRDELRETVDQFRLTASKMGKAVLIANATLKAKQAFDRTCVGFPASDPPEPCIAAAERAADGAAVTAEAAVIEAAEGDDASFTRSHIAALTDETKAAIRQWARQRLSRGSSESNDCHGRAVQAFAELALYFYAVALQHCSGSRTTWRQGFTGVEIRIQNLDALLNKKMADAAFATSDPTGEADAPLPSLPAVFSTQGIGPHP